MNIVLMIRKFQIFSLALIAILLGSCVSSDQVGSISESDLLGGNFVGCTSGAAVDNTTIHVNFDYPSNADRVMIYRDGFEIFSTNNSSNTSFIDTGLREGKTYFYTCKAFTSGRTITGLRTVEVTTSAINPPSFAGIVSATANGSTSANLSWLPPTGGALVNTYRVYATPGSSIDYANDQVSTVSFSLFNITQTNLGDELDYIFGVRACNVSNICDTNTVTRSISLADTGAPTTPGVTAVTIVNGKARLTIPWTHSNGGVYRRFVYRSTIGGTNIANYTLLNTIAVPTISAPPTTFEDATIVQNTTYYYIVRDQDPTGNTSTNTNIVSISTGDLTAPNGFLGTANIARGTPSDSVIRVGFTATMSEAIDSVNGASHYRFYVASAVYPAVAANACSSGTLYGEIDATAYTNGVAYTYDLTGLNQRSNYSVCVEARDSSGNQTGNGVALTTNTTDLTPPNFDGVQTVSFNPLTGISVGWNPSSSSDILEYKVNIWVNNAAPAPAAITTLVRSHASYSSGDIITNSNYAYVDNDTVYFTVDACDSAASIPGSVQNCTSFATSTARTVLLPDVTPPAGFAGISGTSTSVSEGQATINWFEPAWTPDYNGFIVFQVQPDNSLLQLKLCPCVTPGSCNSGDVSCSVTGLNAYRTYKFHVRAYDAYNNRTTYLNPATSFFNVRTMDTTAPNFSSNLQIGGSPTFTLSWDAATDNQYDSNTINYEVWRKAGSTFATATNPSADGSLMTGPTITTRTFNDPALVEGQTYYYTICALDMSSNRACDGNVLSFTVPDITAPTIVNLATNHGFYKKSWNLTWDMADNSTADGSMLVRIYRSSSATKGTATTSDTLIYTGIGVESRSGLTPIINTDAWLNYLVQVEDAAGNTASATISVETKNQVTITNVARNKGPTTGGTMLTITGTGFTQGHNNGHGNPSIFSHGTSSSHFYSHTADLNLAADGTLEYWFKPHRITGGAQRVPVSAGGGAIRNASAQYQNEFRVYDGASYNVATASLSGKWYHVVLTYEQATQTINTYINGTLVLGPLSTTFTDFRFRYIGGNNSSGTDSGYVGNVDEVAVYNRILTPTEIADHYAQKTYNGYVAQVLGDSPTYYYHLDSNYFNRATAVDSMGNQDLTCTDCPGIQQYDNPFYEDGSTVTVGGVACEDVTVHSLYKITCKTPAGTAGPRNVVVRNPDGSSATALSAFQYETVPTHICDNPGSWNADGDFAAGIGSLADPYIVCNTAQVAMMGNQVGENGADNSYASSVGGYYFKLGQTIDMTGYYNFPGIPQIGSAVNTANNFKLYGDGNSLIGNYQYQLSTSTDPYFGFIRFLGNAEFKDISFLNFKSICTSTLVANFYCGIVSAGTSGGTIDIDNVHVTGYGFVEKGRIAALWSTTNSLTVTINDVKTNSTLIQIDGSSMGGIQAAGRVKSFQNSESHGEMMSFDTNSQAIGGIAGSMDSTVGADRYFAYNTNYSNIYSHTTSSYHGGIVGTMSYMERSYLTNYGNVYVPNSTYVGGIFGWSNSEITNSHHLYNYGTITGDWRVGGIRGSRQTGGTVGLEYQEVHNYGDVYGRLEVGGIFGLGQVNTDTDESINGCSSSGNIYISAGATPGRAGGVMGGATEETSVRNCFVTGDIIDQSTGATDIGGIVGRFMSDNATINNVIENSYFSGNIIATSADQVGGIVGNLYMDTGNLSVRNSYFTGTIDARADVGGITGRIYNITNNVVGIEITNSYVAGLIEGVTNVGAAIGYCYLHNTYTGATVTDNISGIYYDSTVIGSDPTGPMGLETTRCTTEIVGETITAQNTAGMQNQVSPGVNGVFGPAGGGWDFGSIWEWSAGSGVYPSLQGVGP